MSSLSPPAARPVSSSSIAMGLSIAHARSYDEHRPSSGPSSDSQASTATSLPPPPPPSTSPAAAQTSRALPRDNCDRRRPQETDTTRLKKMSHDLSGKAISPFLKEHIPDLYAPVGKTPLEDESTASAVSRPRDPHTRYCYRHRPDSKCRRAADETKMGFIQTELNSLPAADQQAITHVWSLFSAAPAKHRDLMLQGIITQCCFPQLSTVSREVQEQLKIDFLAALPTELSYKVLCHLDTVSLCKAAQVSRRWRSLADDDVVWHRMCEQHIDRKCTKCGWGLPLLEKKKLTAWSQHQKTHRQVDDDDGAQSSVRENGNAVVANGNGSASPSRKRALPATDGGGSSRNHVGDPGTDVQHGINGNDHQDDGAGPCKRPRLDSPNNEAQQLSSQSSPRPSQQPESSCSQRQCRPWKHVYRDRFKVGCNWKTGRCAIKTFKGHENGVTCLQFDGSMLATGSYDTTIKIWNMDTGEVLRTLRGHTAAVRTLQFDESKLISGSFDRTIKIWNWQTGECLSTLQCHTDGVLSVHYDGCTLASGSIDRTVKIFSFDTKQTFCLRGHSDWVNHVRIDSPSRVVFSASDDMSVKMWDLDTKQCIRTFRGHVGQVQQVLLMPSDFEPDALPSEEDQTDGTSGARRGGGGGGGGGAGSSSRSSRSSSRDNTPPPPPPLTTTTTTTMTSMMTTGSLGASLVERGSCATGATNSTALMTDARAALGPGFTSDPDRPLPPRYMLTGGLDSTVRLWDIETGRCTRSMFGHVEGIWGLVGDTLRVVTGANDSVTKIWEPRSGKCERSFTDHAGPVTCVGLSDSRMASGSEDGEVRLYSFEGDDGEENGTPSWG